MSAVGRTALFAIALAAGFAAAWTIARATRSPSPADLAMPYFQTCLSKVPRNRPNLERSLIEADCVRSTAVLRGLTVGQVQRASGYLIIPGPPVRAVKPPVADWWNACP